MILCKKPAESCFQLLGLQKTSQEESLRPFTFIVRKSIEEGELFYNTMTKEMVLLSPDEVSRFDENPESIPELVAHWFAVPIGHDDRLLARQYREVARLIAPPVKAISSYTIFTTTDCNARCFYCYELGRSRNPMSLETAERAAAYIIKQSNEEKVTLHWFGGEPLYNKSVITLICKRLQENGIHYKSRMISNGYLFDQNTILEAKNLWRLQSVQITIDGTEDVYNKTKAFIYKNGNPYRVVIGNIHHLLEADISVNIRINVDVHNAENLLSLIEELHSEFEGAKKLSIYSHELFDTDHLTFNKNETRRFIYEKRMQILQKLEEWGLVSPPSLSREVRYSFCMADNDASVSILTDGHLGKCEHYSDNNWFGHIDSPEHDEEVISRFKALREEYEECAHCARYPDCIRLKMCQDIDECVAETREEYIRHTQRAMLAAYEKFKKGELTEKFDDDEAEA